MKKMPSSGMMDGRIFCVTDYETCPPQDLMLPNPRPVPNLAAPGYQSGFCNEFSSEAVAGALPAGVNSPQRVPFALYAEQLSGTAFTAPRREWRRSGLYRIRPSALHREYSRADD